MSKDKKKKKKTSPPYPYQKQYDEFRRLWIANINKSVEQGYLKYAFNSAIQQGYSTDYILFVLKYCIDTHQNLHYPAGFKFFIEKPYIKQAYEEYKIKHLPKVKIDFEKLRREQSTKPTFKAPISKPMGFNSIFKD